MWPISEAPVDLQSGLKVASYNCPAVLGSLSLDRPSRERRKWVEVGALIRSHDIVCLQEVHGTAEDAQRLSLRYSRWMLIFYTPGATHRRAGCLIMIKRAFLRRVHATPQDVGHHRSWARAFCCYCG